MKASFDERIKKIDYGILEEIGEIESESKERAPARDLRVVELQYDVPL